MGILLVGRKPYIPCEDCEDVIHGRLFTMILLTNYLYWA